MSFIFNRQPNEQPIHNQPPTSHPPKLPYLRKPKLPPFTLYPCLMKPPCAHRISPHKTETNPMGQSLLHQAAQTMNGTPPMRPISSSKSNHTREGNIPSAHPKTAEYFPATPYIINRLQILSAFRPFFAQFFPLAPSPKSSSLAANFQLSQTRFRHLQIPYGHLQEKISQETPLSSERTCPQHGLR